MSLLLQRAVTRQLEPRLAGCGHCDLPHVGPLRTADPRPFLETAEQRGQHDQEDKKGDHPDQAPDRPAKPSPPAIPTPAHKFVSYPSNPRLCT
jgi:hypothetical protein